MNEDDLKKGQDKGPEKQEMQEIINKICSFEDECTRQDIKDAHKQLKALGVKKDVTVFLIFYGQKLIVIASNLPES